MGYEGVPTSSTSGLAPGEGLSFWNQDAWGCDSHTFNRLGFVLPKHKVAATFVLASSPPSEGVVFSSLLAVSRLLVRLAVYTTSSASCGKPYSL